ALPRNWSNFDKGILPHVCVFFGKAVPEGRSFFQTLSRQDATISVAFRRRSPFPFFISFRRERHSSRYFFAKSVSESTMVRLLSMMSAYLMVCASRLVFPSRFASLSFLTLLFNLG